MKKVYMICSLWASFLINTSGCSPGSFVGTLLNWTDSQNELWYSSFCSGLRVSGSPGNSIEMQIFTSCFELTDSICILTGFHKRVMCVLMQCLRVTRVVHLLCRDLGSQGTFAEVWAFFPFVFYSEVMGNIWRPSFVYKFLWNWRWWFGCLVAFSS